VAVAFRKYTRALVYTNIRQGVGDPRRLPPAEYSYTPRREYIYETPPPRHLPTTSRKDDDNDDHDDEGGTAAHLNQDVTQFTASHFGPIASPYITPSIRTRSVPKTPNTG
jgi:hypothetical protein